MQVKYGHLKYVHTNTHTRFPDGPEGPMAPCTPSVPYREQTKVITHYRTYVKYVPVFLEVHDFLSLQVALDDPVIRSIITKRTDKYALATNNISSDALLSMFAFRSRSTLMVVYEMCNTTYRLNYEIKAFHTRAPGRPGKPESPGIPLLPCLESYLYIPMYPNHQLHSPFLLEIPVGR